MKTEREFFEEWHYGQYLLENPDVDINNAKYIYDYAHKNPLVYQMRETCFMAWVASASREGYKLVPVEPTTDMWWEGKEELQNNGDATDIYKAMIGQVNEL